MSDFLIVGGGIIGLSLAWELAQRKQKVCVIDRHQPGTGTSWGGAGILPPPRTGATHDPLEQLRTAAHQLHVEWSERLRADVGIDTQLRQCGGIYFARRVGEAIALQAEMLQAQTEGVRCEKITTAELLEREPSLRSIAEQIQVCFDVPDEMQFRSPPHLQALIQACEKLGVEFLPDTEVHTLDVHSDCVTTVHTAQGPRSADQVCVCSGTWAAQLLEPLDIVLPIEPWRGQLLIWDTGQPLFSRVINEGLRYFVPREDGILLVGATVEDVGFDASTTPEAIQGLTEYSVQVLPSLASASPQKAWAGLRSKTPDGRPFMGRVPGFSNLSVCAGHFRAGIHLSPISAVFMAGLLLDDTTPFDKAPFQVQR